MKAYVLFGALIAFGWTAGLELRAETTVGAKNDSAAVRYPLPAVWPEHPRLIATKAEWDGLKKRTASDPELDAYVKGLISEARGVLKSKPLERKLVGRRLLDVSRKFIQENLLCAFAYRITGESVFLERARAEMLNVCAFSDWNPSHFLDVAEMTAGLALGYDWLYDGLSQPDRLTIRTAMVRNSLELGRYGHSTFERDNNWGQVCIGGLTLGALAVGDEEPDLVSTLLAAAKAHAFIALDAYKPDGVYPEGPSYWVYGTTYETLLVSALRTALGTDWGILKAPGLEKSGAFFAHTVGPTGKSFNYSDSEDNVSLSPPIFFFAKELGNPLLAASQHEVIKDIANGRIKKGENDRFAPLAAFWWPFESTNKSKSALATTFIGQGPYPVASWRSSWTDPDALYFAIKGGGAALNHAHMDGGSFILEMNGVRWALDLGKQDYESLESRKIDLWNKEQKSDRWTVFRLSNVAHNTLVLGGNLHNAAGLARMVRADDNGATLDLSPIFIPGAVTEATRTVKIEGKVVQLTDTLRGMAPGTSVRWAMTTGSDIAIDGNTAVLKSGDKRLRVRFVGGAAHLQNVDISIPRADFDAPNPGMRQLVATGVAASDGSWNMNVIFDADAK